MISEKLKNTILAALSLDDFEIEDRTMANQIPGWDSLRHISVILEIEQAYGIRLRNMEVMKCRNIGDLQALIDSKS